ncbi:hypothetical protein DENSPDRAFT_835109 [Dentipellis sp. KUC8613]|nr:hypothetical protein DENSPDRAFT_835109 [Dentipellis sp. KUC8613]
MSGPTEYAGKLETLAPQLAKGGDDVWREAESAAQSLADALRVKSPTVDNHTVLGASQLPQTLTSILKASITGPRIEDESKLAAVYQALRVGANLCMDHDVNRSHLLDAEFPQTVVSILEGYAQSIPSRQPPSILPLSLSQLRVIKTSIGVLLNASVGYEPVKLRLFSLEAAGTILRLSSAIYPPGSWVTEPKGGFVPVQSPSDDDISESWSLRSGLANWAWRAISELKDDQHSLFGPEVLPLLIPPLRIYVPPFTSPPSGFFEQPSALRRALIQADFEVFEETCSLLESLAMDVEDVRLSLARGMTFPDEHGGVNCLGEILKFIDQGDYHPLWVDAGDERSRREKSFDLCKAALIKCVVEIAGEEKNTDVLWDESDAANPGGVFVSQMVRWIKSQKNLKEQSRDDLVICASLSLGNLVRYESHSKAIISEPIELAPHLAALLTPEADLKVKHGVIGLLRHLAYAPPAREPLGKAGIVERLVESNIFKDTSDIAEMIQVSAIGIVKHLSNGNADNCFSLVLVPEGQDPKSSGLQQILDLIRRSDTVAVKSEGTRVFVNVIRTLWSNATPESEKRTKAKELVTTPAVAFALAQLIGRSKKYPALINEGMVALTLLTLQKFGGNIALDAITTPLPQEAQQPAPAAIADPNDVSSPVVAPGRALDMLVTVLKNHGGRFQEEVRINVCTLVGHIGRKGATTADREAELAKVKAEVKPLLEQAAASERESRLKLAAAKALQLWE